MSKMASFAPFTLELTEISFEALNSSAHALEALRGGSYWAVVWTVDLSRLASKGGLKDELTHMRKILGCPHFSTWFLSLRDTFGPPQPHISISFMV